MIEKSLDSLRQGAGNPRIATAKFHAKLDRSLKEFGDLGCIIFNTTTGQLLGGNQRTAIAQKDAGSKVIIETTYESPTSAGTTAEGYMLINGERHKYREVEWDIHFEKSARIAANALHAEWDQQLLGEDVRSLIETDEELARLAGFDDEQLRVLSDGGQLGERADGVIDAKPKVTRYTSDELRGHAARYAAVDASSYATIIAFCTYLEAGDQAQPPLQ